MEKFRKEQNKKQGAKQTETLKMKEKLGAEKRKLEKDELAAKSIGENKIYNITGTEKESKKDKDMQQSSATIPKATASLEDLKSYWTRKEYALVEDKNKRLTPSEISGLLSLEDIESYWNKKEYTLAKDKNKCLTPSEISDFLLIAKAKRKVMGFIETESAVQSQPGTLFALRAGHDAIETIDSYLNLREPCSRKTDDEKDYTCEGQHVIRKEWTSENEKGVQSLNHIYICKKLGIVMVHHFGIETHPYVCPLGGAIPKVKKSELGSGSNINIDEPYERSEKQPFTKVTMNKECYEMLLKTHHEKILDHWNVLDSLQDEKDDLKKQLLDCNSQITRDTIKDKLRTNESEISKAQTVNMDHWTRHAVLSRLRNLSTFVEVDFSQYSTDLLKSDSEMFQRYIRLSVKRDENFKIYKEAKTDWFRFQERNEVATSKSDAIIKIQLTKDMFKLENNLFILHKRMSNIEKQLRKAEFPAYEEELTPENIKKYLNKCCETNREIKTEVAILQKTYAHPKDIDTEKKVAKKNWLTQKQWNPKWYPAQLAPTRWNPLTFLSRMKRANRNKYEFIEVYETYIKKLGGFPETGSHFKETDKLPYWTTKTISASELFFTEPFLTRKDMNKTVVKENRKELHVTGARTSTTLTLEVKFKDGDMEVPETICIIQTSKETEENTLDLHFTNTISIPCKEWDKFTEILEETSNYELEPRNKSILTNKKLCETLILRDELRENPFLSMYVTNRRRDLSLERTCHIKVLDTNIEFPWVFTPVVLYHSMTLRRMIEDKFTQ